MAELHAAPAQGSELLIAVRVMDRLRSPGGCPWDAAQTHQSLVRYLIEECYELVQAINDEDPRAICEELGDVLLQVLFHARIASEDTSCGFDIDEVATTLTAKLIGRHPQVFADGEATAGADHQQQHWEELKRAEVGRSSALSGVSMSAPAASLAAKLGSRALRYEVEVPLPPGTSAAEKIFRIAYQAGRAGEDPEAALLSIAKDHAKRMQELERRRDLIHGESVVADSVQD